MDKLYEIIAKLSGEIKISAITEETDLITDGSYDSLKFIQLISEIEETFQIEFDIDDVDLKKLRSMKNLMQLINEKIGDKKNG